ncbi:hypothetical protein [Microvirga terrestris]|uniref:hypothetical protein n=1 Tax=Microvirga terrestris TaxID=2791024 RepID=UPI001FEE9099|nr:hypothetical protein [Microvirga terrestris]
MATSGRVRPGPDDLPPDVVFLAKPYLLVTVINVIWQMAMAQVIGLVPNAAQA